MAPALTESAQTQNFKFVTSPSRSPSLSLKNHLKIRQEITVDEVQPKLSNGIDNFVGMNGYPPVNKTTYSINGLVKNLRNEFLPLDKKNSGPNDKDNSDVNYSLTQIGGYIMNSGFVGDPNMGLQKSNSDINDGGKNSPEVEQLQKNLAGIISAEINSNPVLNQNVEEIFKAMSSTLDSTSSEIESATSGENIFPDMTTALNGTELGSFERGLFNEVDIMNMCVDETLVTVSKDTFMREKIERARKRQLNFTEKLEDIKKKLRNIKTRTVGKQVAEEITGVLEYSSKLSGSTSRVRNFSTSSPESNHQVDNKSVPPAGISHFVRQIENAVNQQSNTVSLNPNRQCKYFGSGSSTNSLVSTSNGVRASLPGSVLPPFSPQIRQELETTFPEINSQLVEVQEDIDSDVTESSSGCESSDEFINYNNVHQHQLSIGKRALWKWLEERAAIATKWMWLQSQISDLDYRVKQVSDLKRTLRGDKGCLKFEGELPGRQHNENSCSRTRPLVRNSLRKRKLLQIHGLHRTSKRAGRMPSIRCTCTSSIPGCALCTGRLEPGQPADPLSSMPVHQRIAVIDPAFHPVLSLPNDVSSSLHYDAVMKCTEWQTKASRILGKPSNLSPPQPSPSHVEDTSRGRPPSCESHVVDLQRSKAAAVAVSFNIKRKFVRGKRRKRNLTLERYRRRRAASSVSTVNCEETVEQDIDATNGNQYPSPEAVPSQASASTSSSASASASSSVIASTSAQAPTVSKDKDATVKRKRENSYDIDNIVIPYSIASSTRPEKLNYKEIQTPKWRILPQRTLSSEPKNGIRRSSHDNTDYEDKSEESNIARHERCQIEERKRFLKFMKLPGGGGSRGRGQRRTDSRADSSEPNTPDGMSPRDDGPSCHEEHPVVTSPPLQHIFIPQANTPPQTQPTVQSLPSLVNQPPSQPQASCENETVRRRTVSSYTTQPYLVFPEVDPFEPRVFPISEEDYKKAIADNGDYQQIPPNNAAYQSSVGPNSPGSISTDSAESSYFCEDPNDPEWTSADRQNNKR